MTDQAVSGLRELDRALAQLPEKIERNWMRGAMRSGAKVQLAAARAAAPVGDPSAEGQKLYGGYRGALRDSLRIQTSSRNGVVKAKVVAGGKSKKSGAAVFYAHMVEGGTEAHEIKPRAHRSLFFAGLLRQLVQHPGARARPFMKPTLYGTVSAAVEAVAGYLRARFARADIDVPGPENY